VARELLAHDFSPGDSYALGDRNKMRRRVEADAQPGRAADAFEHRRRRALAVRACDLDGGEGVLRAAEPAEQARDVLQPELDGHGLVAET
jgi:hypothetical protein